MIKPILTWIVAGILLAQSFLPRTAMDLLRSSDVWAHYREHQQEQQKPLSFLDFLSFHCVACFFVAKKQHVWSHSLLEQEKFFFLALLFFYRIRFYRKIISQ